MKLKTLLTAIVFTGSTILVSNAQIAISGYLANPSGTDSPYEYVQLVATQNIDFSATPMSVVFANDGSASANGWVAGGGTTYELSLNSGTVNVGQTFYVGGSGKTIDGAGSTDISLQTWIRAVDTASSGGDLFGNAASAGVLGNGTGNADGIAVFDTTSLTASSVPVDAVFYGSSVGNASTGTSSGYMLPVNDLYKGGYLQADSTVLPDPSSDEFTALSGAYNTSTGTWTTNRTATLQKLSSGSNPSKITSQILVTNTTAPVPEPTTLALSGMGLIVFWRLQRRKS